MMKTIWRQIKTSFIDLVFPEHLMCYLCGCEMPPGQTQYICDTCEGQITKFTGKICSQCGREIDIAYAQHADYFYKCKECQEQFVYFNRHRAYAYYEGPIKEALIGLKYRKQKYQSNYLGLCLADLVLSDHELSRFDFVVPVPVHYSRALSRGYNQAQLISEALCSSLGFGISKQMLKRSRHTKKLKHLGRSSRKEMMNQAFTLNQRVAGDLKGKRILLVDDIYTTGATLNACAKVLYENGCEVIHCVTVAKGR